MLLYIFLTWILSYSLAFIIGSYMSEYTRRRGELGMYTHTHFILGILICIYRLILGFLIGYMLGHLIFNIWVNYG